MNDRREALIEGVIRALVHAYCEKYDMPLPQMFGRDSRAIHKVSRAYVEDIA